MSNTNSYDFIIAGAGIIGLTTAYELKKQFPFASISILEKENKPGMHASGRNSGVLHSGIFYAIDSLKAQLCSKGALRMRNFAAEHKIHCERKGKIIIATSEDQLPTVELLLQNAKENNICAERLDEQSAKEIEPNANPYKVGIHSPDTSVIDSLGVLSKLYDLLIGDGVNIFFNQDVIKVRPAENCLYSQNNKYNYGRFINCAGANADIIAHQFGVGREYALLPFKGTYYKLRDQAKYLIKNSVYPVPDVSLPFLGIHLTRVISGDIYVGPTAIPAFGRENYGILEGVKLSEGFKIGWGTATMYLRNNQNFRRLVHTEIRKYHKANFLKETRKLVPRVMYDDLIPSDKVGIRPQLVNLREQKLVMDFLIEQTTTSIHVLNAISPAFTCSFAFAELLVARLSKID
jgi:(S)-2-hydroxyglutarate dehydrogenase